MTTIIHIDRKALLENKMMGKRDPVVRVQEGDNVYFCMGVDIQGPCRVIYEPDRPLPSKARLWIETEAEVKVLK